MRAAANGAHTLQNVPDYYNKEEELHMNQFTKAVKSLAAKIALKEQTKNRMNFETGYLFCHVET